MRITVIGAGGTGGYFGAKLAKAGEDVSFLARGAHLRAMRESGLTIKSAVEGQYCVPVRALETLSGQPAADLVLFCVKSFDTESAAEMARPVIGPDTAVLSVQNGVDGEERIGRVLGPQHVMGGVAYVFAHIAAPGVIAHNQFGRIVFGEMDGRRSPRAERIQGVLANAGIPAEIAADIRKTLWEKYLSICPVSGTTALTRLPVRFIRETPETRMLWEAQVDELLRLAEFAGAGLGADMKQRCVAFLEALAPSTTSSLYEDLMAGKRLELEALQGYAVRLGQRAGIATPALFAVLAALKPWINGRPAEAGK